MFYSQLAAFAVLAVFAGTSLASWVPDDEHFNWQSRCGSDSLYSNHLTQYVCFECKGDITKPPTDGLFKGYTDETGTRFVLVRELNESETTLRNPDRDINITWGKASAYVKVHKFEGRWVPIVGERIKTGDHLTRKTFKI